MRTPELVFVPLGGVGEIGMNFALYGFGPQGRRRWIIVDCGVAFADDQLPGIDLVLPDIRFIEEERANLEAILLTHAHEDHFGALADLWPRLKVPVYATPFTAGLLEAKRLSEPGAPAVEVRTIASGARIKVGPFDVEYVPVAHSIPESHSLFIRTAAGNVLHTGDWKLDPDPVLGGITDPERFTAIGREGVDVLLCDSTNALRDGVSPSEADVAINLAEVVARAPGRVAVTTFASNVARIRSVAEAAAKAGREVVTVGRAMDRVVRVARELGYLDGIAPFRDESAFAYLPRDKVLALCTGSQGEARAALARIAAGDHPRVSLSPGDLVVFSSRTIPGNERSVYRIINGLVGQGIEVLTDRDAMIHVSGHPRRGEIAEMYRWTQPKALVPVHGEMAHLTTHAAFGRASGIPDARVVRNGDMVRLLPGPLEVVDEVPSGRLVKDGAMLRTPEESGVRDRRRLSYAGVVFVSLILNSKGEMIDDPQVALLGLPEEDDIGTPLGVVVEDTVMGTIESIPRPRRRDSELVADAVRRSVRAAINQIWGKKPLCKVLVSRI
ncbi:MAG TPA: ribonuclease J [Hyphomicrobiales bacterium]|nr:ribonuclease J [Hyphomicrobiales bacterium]